MRNEINITNMYYFHALQIFEAQFWNKTLVSSETSVSKYLKYSDEIKLSYDS